MKSWNSKQAKLLSTFALALTITCGGTTTIRTILDEDRKQQASLQINIQTTQKQNEKQQLKENQKNPEQTPTTILSKAQTYISKETWKPIKIFGVTTPPRLFQKISLYNTQNTDVFYAIPQSDSWKNIQQDPTHIWEWTEKHEEKPMTMRLTFLKIDKSNFMDAQTDTTDHNQNPQEDNTINHQEGKNIQITYISQAEIAHAIHAQFLKAESYPWPEKIAPLADVEGALIGAQEAYESAGVEEKEETLHWTGLMILFKDEAVITILGEVLSQEINRRLEFNTLHTALIKLMHTIRFEDRQT